MQTRIFILGGIMLTVGACAKRPVPLGPTPITSGVNNDSIARARADSIARADAIRNAELARQKAIQDSLDALRAAQNNRDAANASAMATLSATVYFDYDQSILSDTAKTLLSAKVAVLQSHPSFYLHITGHTDQRGSSEYNLALGLRRAAEAKAYMVANGIDASRMEIFSLGAERPAVQGTGEEVWSKNRRDEFVPTTESSGR